MSSARPLRSDSARLAFAITIALFVAACAGNECRFHSQCGERSYCSKGRCFQACQRDVDCAPGEHCSEIGMCVGSEAPGEDARVTMPDAFVPPAPDGGSDAGHVAPGVDAGMDASVDAGRDAGVNAGTDAGFDAGRGDDASVDAGIDAGVDAGIDAGVDAGIDAGVDAGPPSFSTYSYRRIPVGGLRDALAIAFHPDGSYAIILERSEAVHIYDWASDTATRIPLSTGGRTLYLDDLELAEDGSAAWIVGYERTGSSDTGVIIELDDARWRAGDGAEAFSRLHRVEGGAFRPTSTSPALAHGIFDVSLSPDGRLALIIGRAGGSPLRGQVFEYRHDLWSRAEIHDVSIEGFGGPPYSATSNTQLNDSAFRPGCDAGLIVGGHSSHAGSTGYLIEFSRDLSPPCR